MAFCDWLLPLSVMFASPCPSSRVGAALPSFLLGSSVIGGRLAPPPFPVEPPEAPCRSKPLRSCCRWGGPAVCGGQGSPAGSYLTEPLCLGADRPTSLSIEETRRPRGRQRNVQNHGQSRDCAPWHHMATLSPWGFPVPSPSLPIRASSPPSSHQQVTTLPGAHPGHTYRQSSGLGEPQA